MATLKKSRSKVGVIGLGIIGTRVAANLRSAGHQVYVWSRTPRAAPNFLGSIVEVADLCDVIQLFISDGEALDEVIRTAAAALRPRHVVLCHATVSPEATRRAAGIVESQGARYLDAPFTGSKSAAQNKQLVYYIGGAKPALEEVRGLLEATSKAVLHVGGVGDASVLKIATNMLTASTVQTLAEALALVRAAGIDASKLVEALENNASRSGTSDLKLPAMIAANSETNFSLKHMLKDVRFAQQLADKYELSLPLTDTTAEVFELGMQNDWADEDFSVVSQLYPAPLPPVVPKTDKKLAEVIAKPTVEAPAAPKPEAKEQPSVKETLPPKPVSKEQPPIKETPAQNPVATEKSAAEEPPAPEPVPKEVPPGVVLPPRPGSVAKPDQKPLLPVEKPDEPAPANVSKKPATDQLSAPVVGMATDTKTPTAEPTGAPVPNAEPEAKREKKSTFRFIRNIFKPASSDGR